MIREITDFLFDILLPFGTILISLGILFKNVDCIFIGLMLIASYQVHSWGKE